MIVPLHREIARGTLASILRQAGLTTDELRGEVHFLVGAANLLRQLWSRRTRRTWSPCARAPMAATPISSAAAVHKTTTPSASYG